MTFMIYDYLADEPIHTGLSEQEADRMCLTMGGQDKGYLVHPEKETNARKGSILQTQETIKGGFLF